MTASRSPVAFGQYIITRRIARGGMAEIYRARTRSTPDQPSQWLAIKMMRPSLGHEELREQLFKREARIASMITHPNVIPLFAFGLEMERHYIAMEYVRGRDLSHLLRNDKKGRDILPFELGLYIGFQAASGLGYAHRLRDEKGEPLGIVHRDISPGNVMVGYDGNVKVLDFGVARMNDSEGMQTQTGTLRGKFAYMSPEQTLGEALDARSDVFSLGTVLYELLTGSNCFRADNPIATLDRVQRVRPVPPSKAHKGIPQAIDRILARCLAKDKKRRFPDCAALEEALGEFLDKWGWTGRDGLARHMRERFQWEMTEEEKELAREEEEVALLEVVDFALVGEDVGLDAANLAVSQEEEASHSEVKSVGLRPRSQDEGENVFDVGSESEISAALEPPSDPDASSSDQEATVAYPSFVQQQAAQAAQAAKVKRFVDDEEIEGQSVELSSLLKAAEEADVPQAPSNSLVLNDDERTAHARSIAVQDPPKPRPPSPKSNGLGMLLVGRRAPEFLGQGVRAAPPDPEDTGDTSRRRFSTEHSVRVKKLSHPAVVIGALGGLVLLVATLVTMGIEGQKNPSSVAAAPKRTKIAPVTITIDDAKKAARTRGDAVAEKAEELKTAAAERRIEKEPPAAAATESEPEHDEASAGREDDDPPAGDAVEEDTPQDEKSPSTPKTATRRTRSGSKSRSSKERTHEKRERERERERDRERDKPKEADKAKKEKVVTSAAASGKQTGFLNVGAKPWAEIAIDGQKWPYQTPQAGIELPVGKHTVTLSNRETGVTHSQTVLIAQGTYKTISMDMTKK